MGSLKVEQSCLVCHAKQGYKIGDIRGEENGTGLGLYMSKVIIEKHLKGNLSVINESKGAIFHISLPKLFRP